MKKLKSLKYNEHTKQHFIYQVFLQSVLVYPETKNIYEKCHAILIIISVIDNRAFVITASLVYSNKWLRHLVSPEK
jgi:hypothetical protein